jgi:peptide deformylase
MKPKILRITQLGEPVLRRKLKPVRHPTSRTTLKQVIDMVATMRKAQGVGIAANQVGIDQRLFIVAPEPSVRYPKAPTIPPLAMMNPKLVKHSRAMETDWEGCLSIPGLRARVPRYRSIEIEFTALDGKTYQAKLKGFVARIFQHEFDHINGMVYMDRVKDTRTFMMESRYRLLWK